MVTKPDHEWEVSENPNDSGAFVREVKGKRFENEFFVRCLASQIFFCLSSLMFFACLALY